jgi:hypothetical protein
MSAPEQKARELFRRIYWDKENASYEERMVAAIAQAIQDGRRAGIEEALTIAERHRTYDPSGMEHGRGLNVAVHNVVVELMELKERERAPPK